ncbi:VG15 protein [Streptomyces celluloflavus]|uniref:VG15 protein n=1 Tax=Streptomyces celluloflavus TaxID=58344 RepID=UPI00364ED293
MADQGAEITETHRLGQVQISAGASRAVLDRWRQVSPTALEQTAGRWLEESLSLTRTYRRRSRRLTADYVRLLRALRTGETLPPLDGGPVRDEASLGELRDHFAVSAGASRRPHRDDAVRVSVDTDFEWPQADTDAEDRRATVSLVVTGPVAAERRISRLRAQRGRLDDADFLADLDGIMRDAGAAVAGAADRDAQMGGRDLMQESSHADRAVIGWARVTDGDPCWFCAMLASRGAVYRNAWTARYQGHASRRRGAGSDPPPGGWEDWSPERLARWEVGRGLARFHNNCHCTLVPVYSRTDWVPEASRAYRELYEAVTEGLTGSEARAAYRAAMAARRARVRSRQLAV